MNGWTAQIYGVWEKEARHKGETVKWFHLDKVQSQANISFGFRNQNSGYFWKGVGRDSGGQEVREALSAGDVLFLDTMVVIWLYVYFLKIH